MFVDYNALFAVYQSQRALVVRLGQLCKSLSSPSPGLNFKIPFIDRVIAIETRMLDREMPAQEVIASVRSVRVAGTSQSVLQQSSNQGSAKDLAQRPELVLWQALGPSLRDSYRIFHNLSFCELVYARTR